MKMSDWKIGVGIAGISGCAGIGFSERLPKAVIPGGNAPAAPAEL